MRILITGSSGTIGTRLFEQLLERRSIIMLTVIKPLYDSLRGFIKKPDIAWLMHPVLSFTTVAIYGFTVISWYIRKLKPVARKEREVG